MIRVLIFVNYCCIKDYLEYRIVKNKMKINSIYHSLIH